MFTISQCKPLMGDNWTRNETVQSSIFSVDAHKSKLEVKYVQVLGSNLAEMRCTDEHTCGVHTCDVHELSIISIYDI